MHELGEDDGHVPSRHQTVRVAMRDGGNFRGQPEGIVDGEHGRRRAARHGPGPGGTGDRFLWRAQPAPLERQQRDLVRLPLDPELGDVEQPPTRRFEMLGRRSNVPLGEQPAPHRVPNDRGWVVATIPVRHDAHPQQRLGHEQHELRIVGKRTGRAVQRRKIAQATRTESGDDVLTVAKLERTAQRIADRPTKQAPQHPIAAVSWCGLGLHRAPRTINRYRKPVVQSHVEATRMSGQ